MRPALFLDRDGTVIREVHYIREPARVELLGGAPQAIARMQRAGYACVLVSNQAGVGRGIVTMDEVQAVQAEVERQLAALGVTLDGWYFCPVAPTSADRTVIDHPDRKPAPGMLLRAARELDLDLAHSWMVGDMASDLLAGRNAGCAGSILVRTGHGTRSEPEAAALATHVADDLAAAVDWLFSTPSHLNLSHTKAAS
jgi:histidinol-phosphate phosphatase family protein